MADAIAKPCRWWGFADRRHRPAHTGEGIFHDLANGFQSVFTHGLHQAAIALATAAVAATTAAATTNQAMIVSCRPRLSPAVVEVEEASESSFHPALNSALASPSCFQLLLSKINAASS